MMSFQQNLFQISFDNNIFLYEISTDESKNDLKEKLFSIYQAIESDINHCIDLKIKLDTIQFNLINHSLNICICKKDFELGFSIPNISNHKQNLINIITQL